jgi:outer membrane protein OmpA-like peptidoglycan-associated protein
VEFNQTLSEERAMTIYNYLIKKGISKERLSAVGLSASQMINPIPKNLKEQEANRRVEIKITSME